MQTLIERQTTVLDEWIEREKEYIAEEGAADAVLVLLQNTRAAVAGGAALDEAAIKQLGMALYDASMTGTDAVCGDTDSADNLEHELNCTLWRYQPVSEQPNQANPKLVDAVMLDTRTGVYWRLEGAQFVDWDMANDDDEWPEEDMIESGWERVEEPIHPDLMIFEE